LLRGVRCGEFMLDPHFTHEVFHAVVLEFRPISVLMALITSSNVRSVCLANLVKNLWVSSLDLRRNTHVYIE
jgi:hypothetical protein